MVSESTLAIQIRTALAQYLKRDVAKISPSDRLREDLGLDSLAMIELLFKIEEHFDLEIPNEDLSRIVTVADVTAYVDEKLAEQAAGGRSGAAPARPPGPASAAVPAPPAVRTAPAPAAARSAPARAAARTAPAPAAARGPAASRSAASARPPAKVTSIKVATKRKAARTAAKPAPKKKGSRRA